MANTEPLPSPTDRQRKRTVISHSYPDLQVLADRNETNSNDIVAIEKLPTSSSSSNDDVFVDETNNNKQEKPEPVVNNSKISEQDTQERRHNHDGEEATNDTRQSHNNNSPKINMPDIVYDETKPKRLSNPKALKLDITNEPTDTLHESIVFLISPDEPDCEISPSRRRRKPFPSVRSEPNVQIRGNDTEDCIRQRQSTPQQRSSRSPSPVIRRIPNHEARVDKNVQNDASNSPMSRRQQLEIDHIDSSPSASPERLRVTHRYEQSPETARRKISSPVQRLIVKTGAAAAAANSKNRRKSSSEARLGVPPHDIPPKVNVQPRRKISSDARLELNFNHERLVLPVESGRKRKVSFDTSALINGTRVGPLNDEFIVVREQHIAEEAPNIEQEYDDVSEHPEQSENHIPQVVVTTDEDEGFEQDEKEDEVMEESSSGYSEDVEEGVRGFDNRGYVPYDEEYLGPYENHSSTENGEPAIIPHTSSSVSHRVSTTSLPANIGRSRLSNELTPPKSILKTRREDAESVASEDSVQSKSFKLRKDSIALFMDQHGSVAIEALKKEHSHRFRCFGKSDLKQLWDNRNFILEKYKLHLLVLALFLLTFAFVIVGLHFHSEHRQFLATSQKVFFDAKPRLLSLSDIQNQDILKGSIGLGIPSWKMPTHCYQNYKNILDKTCLKWKSHGQLDIAYFLQNSTQCYNITWSLLPGTSAYDCYDIGPGYWFGPLNMTRSQWPITSTQFTFTVSKSKHHGSGTFSSAVEYYWLSSRGEAVVVDSNYPLEISWNTKQRGSFCVIGKAAGDFYNDVEDAPLKTFKYTVCNGMDIQSTHSLIRKKFYPTLTNLPEKDLMESPHWSAVSDSDDFNLNDTVVQSVADSILEHKLNCSTVQIDGKWEKRFGDLSFDTISFDNLTEVTTKVTQAGCKLSLNIYPFFSVHSSNFVGGMQKGYFVRDVGGTVPALVKWEHGVGAMLDVSNPAARDWFASKVRHLASEYDIKTFRLVYGSSSWFPHSPVFHIENISPSKVKLMFVDLMASLGNVVVESTSQSQHISTLVSVPSSIVPADRIFCLRNVIPDVLNLGLMGYPFMMSDGFITEETHADGDFILPSRDLFIRWMQLSAFFPAIRYTVKPWQYDTKVIETSRNLTKFHIDVILDLIERSRDEILNGAPIVRPMWWNHSKDKTTFLIDDQFFLLDAYLVAPVLCECGTDNDVAVRDIYIPAGVWNDVAMGKIIIGPRWIRQYKAEQFQIPVFKRMSEYVD